MNGESVRVVVLTYGDGGQHRPLLASLVEEGVAPEAILVVHNPASPGEPDPALPQGCELMRSSHNLGYAAAMNRGIERQLELGAELLLLLTHDARLHQGALAALLESARGHAEYGVLGPSLVLAGAGTPFSFGGVTRANGSMAHRRTRPPAVEGIARSDWVDGGTMLVRAEVARSVGGFDERFWGYCEEADFCLRARRGGFEVGVVLAAEADQAPGGAKRPGPWAYLITRNGIAYAWRATGLRGLAFVTARAALTAVYSSARAGLRALGLRRGEAVEPWALAVGTARGALDFYRRRWGSPPSLPGAGDLKNVEQRAGGAGDG